MTRSLYDHILVAHAVPSSNGTGLQISVGSIEMPDELEESAGRSKMPCGGVIPDFLSAHVLAELADFAESIADVPWKDVKPILLKGSLKRDEGWKEAIHAMLIYCDPNARRYSYLFLSILKLFNDF